MGLLIEVVVFGLVMWGVFKWIQSARISRSRKKKESKATYVCD